MKIRIAKHFMPVPALRFPGFISSPALFFLAGLFFAAFAVSVHAQVFSPKQFTLDNGMDAIVIERPGLPIVTHMVWYKAGSLQDPYGRSGVAHFLEHMMFRGTETYSDGVFSDLIAQNGGEDNAFTSWEVTAYFQNMPRDKLKLVMQLEADRMENLLLNREAFEREKEVILEERNMRVGNRPSAILAEQMNAAFYLNQGYRRPIIGWEEEIRSIGYEDLTGFYNRYYAPNNAVLVVAGDVTLTEVKELAEQTYGKLAYKTVLQHDLMPEPDHRLAQKVVLHDENVGQPLFRKSYLAPSYLAGESRHALALQVLEELLDKKRTGALYRHFILDEKLATSVSVSYGPTQKGMSTFDIFISPRDGISLEKIDAALSDFLPLLAKQVTNKTEIELAIERLQAEAILAQDSLQAGAYLLGKAKAINLPLSYIENWPARIATVAPEDVAAAFSHVIQDQKSITGYLLPEQIKPDSGEGETEK